MRERERSAIVFFSFFFSISRVSDKKSVLSLSLSLLLLVRVATEALKKERGSACFSPPVVVLIFFLFCSRALTRQRRLLYLLLLFSTNKGGETR